jgi:transposase
MSHRYPFEQLIEIGDDDNIRDIARRLGVSMKSVHRYKKHGVPSQSADRLAIHIGSHPALVWPNYYQE